jgi:hypothetical protein
MGHLVSGKIGTGKSASRLEIGARRASSAKHVPWAFMRTQLILSLAKSR